MAVTKIWGIHGTVYTVTKYTANQAKTWNGEYSKATCYHMRDTTVGKVMEYTADQMKTEMQYYVTGVNCSDEPHVAARQFYATKNAFGVNDNNSKTRFVCMHGYQSFKPGEVTPEVAHKIGVELAKRVWGDKYEVLVSTHLNTGACHNHFVINNISFVDGSRYLDNKSTYAIIREESDKLCREYGLSVIGKPTHDHSQRDGGFIKAERSGSYTIHSAIKHDIDIAVAAAPRNFNEFATLMEQLGYGLERRGKDMRIIPNIGKRKPRRLRSLGEGYTEQDIEYRIKAQWYNPQKYSFTVYKPKGKAPTSLYGLYVHYCFLLGIYPKERPRNPDVCDVLKEDKMRVQKLSEEAAMMGQYGIETMEQLREHYCGVSNTLEQKIKERKSLRNSLRRTAEGTEREYLKAQIKVISADIQKLRREEVLCQDIAFRSAGIEQVVRLIEEPDRQKEIQPQMKGERDK